MRRLITVGLALLPLMNWGRADERDWKVEDHESISKSFPVATGENAASLEVSNVNGFIHVTGTSGKEIVVKAEKRIRAESQEALADAKKDFKVQMTQDGNAVKVSIDDPSRRGDGRNRKYGVTVDYEIEAPRGAALELHGVNGPIQVKDVTGDFKVNGVNGRIELQEMGGKGTVKDVNGTMKVGFSRNPPGASSFQTVNGSIDMYFHGTPDADLDLRTVHGGVFSDFDVTMQPTTVKGEISGNRFVYRAGGDRKVRSGKGGVEMQFRTVNGTIRLHSKG